MRQASIELITAQAATDHHYHAGASVNLVTGFRPLTGFMVSTEGNEREINDRLVSHYALEAYLTDGKLRDFRRLNMLHNCYLGTWYDAGRGKTYIDISLRFGTIGEALDFARKNHQRAIYNAGTGETIYID